MAIDDEVLNGAISVTSITIRSGILTISGGTNPSITVTGAGGVIGRLQAVDSGDVTIGSTSNTNFDLITNNLIRWTIQAAGHLVASTDNANDIGAVGATRPRNIFVGSSFVNRVIAGTPTDTNVINPTDGMMLLDSTANKIWVRLGGTWKGVAVA